MILQRSRLPLPWPSLRIFDPLDQILAAPPAPKWYRTYDPTLGRYLQSDPIGLAGGLNRYAYAGGNPVGAIDPSGLIELGIRGGISGAFLAGIQYGFEATYDTKTRQFGFKFNYGGLVGIGGGVDMPFIVRKSDCSEAGWTQEAIGELSGNISLVTFRKELSRRYVDSNGNVTKTGPQAWENNFVNPSVERDKKGKFKPKGILSAAAVYSINNEHSFSSMGNCGCSE